MRFGIRTLDDIEVRGKTVLCRVDINQPIDHATGGLRDTTRIQACVPTIRELSNEGARLVLLAHQGSDIEYKNFYTTQPHAAVLSGFLEKEVGFIDDVCGPAARAAIAALRDGDVLLVDNVRFVSEEQTLFEQKLKLTHEQQAKTLLVRKLAPLADLYVCDAFAAAHRDQPSLCGFEQLLPSAMGRLFEEEYCVVSGLMEAPERPCVFVLGGAKISDAFQMMSAVLRKPGGRSGQGAPDGDKGDGAFCPANSAGESAPSDCVKTQNETVGTGDSCHVLPAKWDKMPRPHLSCSEFSHSLPSPLSPSGAQGAQQEAIADKVLAGGLVGQVLLWADGRDIGSRNRALIAELGYEALVDVGRELLAEHRSRIVLPVDAAFAGDGRLECPIEDVTDEHEIIDIGQKTAQSFRQHILSAKTVFVNGPVGVFEQAPGELGTKTVWDALGETDAYTVVGGGDSIAAMNKYGTRPSYVCTGGGALIRFLSGEELPVVKALRHGSKLSERRVERALGG